MQPEIKTVRTVNITPGQLVEAINHTYPELRIPENVQFTDTIEGQKFVGVTLEWNDHVES